MNWVYFGEMNQISKTFFSGAALLLLFSLFLTSCEPPSELETELIKGNGVWVSEGGVETRYQLNSANDSTSLGDSTVIGELFRVDFDGNEGLVFVVDGEQVNRRFQGYAALASEEGSASTWKIQQFDIDPQYPLTGELSIEQTDADRIRVRASALIYSDTGERTGSLVMTHTAIRFVPD